MGPIPKFGCGIHLQDSTFFLQKFLRYKKLSTRFYKNLQEKNENSSKVSLQTVDNYNMGASNIETSTKNKSKKIVFFAKVLVFCVDNYNMGTKNIGARLNNGS